MLDLGRTLTVYLETLLPENESENEEYSLLELSLYLEQATKKSSLRRIFLFDPENQVLFDSREEVEIGQEEPLLEADQEQLNRLWEGQEATTTFYPIEEGYAKRAYIPIRDKEGSPSLGLALEAGSDAFVGLDRFWRMMVTLSLVSFTVGLVSILVLIQVVRRERRVEDILARTERAVEAGQLTAALAHELRNPLGIIHTNAEVLSGHEDLNVREAASDILGESQRLSSLISRFLDLSSQRPADWISGSVGALIEKVVSRYRPQMESKGIQIEIVRHSGNDEIPMQIDRLKSALENLIDNSGHVLEGKSGGWIKIEVKASRKSVRVEIRDNGPGFSNEALKLAVQPFYTDRPQGTGIGLTIVRRVVEDHGGVLTLANHRQGGTLVRLEFRNVRR